MDVFDAIHARRSVRQFKPGPVPREHLRKIVAAGIEAPSGCNQQLRRYVIIDDPAVMDAIRPASRALQSAPAAIAIVMDPRATPYGEFWVQDASAAMQNMLLAAVGLGYGACWVEGALRRCEDDLKQTLNVPAELKLWSILPVGTPAELPDRPDKSQPDEVVYYNRFGGR